MTRPIVTRLAFEDQQLATLDLPGGRLIVSRGLGSGLSKSPDGRIWAVGDRGPNLTIKLAIERYGLERLANQDYGSGAKLMPFPEIGPAISELQVEGNRVTILNSFPLRGSDGAPVSGIPTPRSSHCETEPAISIDGARLPADPSGADTEGIVALADGSFWVGDEYGPSLILVGADGRVAERWVPEDTEEALAGAHYPVKGLLPRIAGKRQLNRGFEAIGVSPDQTVLYLAFQSPLAHPDEAAHERGRWVRLWKLDISSGALLAQFAYPLASPDSCKRDLAKGPCGWSDLKVSELTVLGTNRLLVLERASQSTKLFLVELDERLGIDLSHADPETRPTLEELSCTGGTIPLLRKQLVLDTDNHPEIGSDLEGLVMLAPNSLLLVNDNDFGIAGVATRFWRVDLPEPL